jgi:hypothetical protein
MHESGRPLTEPLVETGPSRFGAGRALVNDTSGVGVYNGRVASRFLTAQLFVLIYLQKISRSPSRSLHRLKSGFRCCLSSQHSCLPSEAAARHGPLSLVIFVVFALFAIASQIGVGYF